MMKTPRFISIFERANLATSAPAKQARIAAQQASIANLDIQIAEHAQTIAVQEVELSALRKEINSLREKVDAKARSHPTQPGNFSQDEQELHSRFRTETDPFKRSEIAAQLRTIRDEPPGTSNAGTEAELLASFRSETDWMKRAQLADQLRAVRVRNN